MTPGAFAHDCRRFFAARLNGPAEARDAVLRELARNEPYPLARRAVPAGGEAEPGSFRALRVGLIAEVLRTFFRTSLAACRGPSLPSRIERARRVLVADTLLTFSFELAADVDGEAGGRVRELLYAAAGPAGFLSQLAAADPLSGEPAPAAGDAIAAASRHAADVAKPWDASYVSAADHAAERFLEAALQVLAAEGAPPI